MIRPSRLGLEEASLKSLYRVSNVFYIWPEATHQESDAGDGNSWTTLYHLKSHLQKYRLGKSQQSESCTDNKQEDYREIQTTHGHNFSTEISDASHNKINESLQIAQALQLQMDVQRKLHEQIEVQRHLQMRIEAQGKYLQSVLKKAQETLAGYSFFFSGSRTCKI
ncbi:hypothetical protein SLA2020_338400 [Shorea laevis]